MALLSPCMFAAPLVAVIAILALPLWPVAIVLFGVLWLLVWPAERVLVALGVRATTGWSVTIAKWFRTVLKPWTFFDPPGA